MVDSNPECIAFGHPHCYKEDGIPVNGLGRGNEIVSDCVTTCKHTTELAPHRTNEHYTDGPCPDSTGTYDTEITNETCKVADKADFLTHTHGEGRVVEVFEHLVDLPVTKVNAYETLGTVVPLDEPCDGPRGFPNDNYKGVPSVGSFGGEESSKPGTAGVT